MYSLPQFCSEIKGFLLNGSEVELNNNLIQTRPLVATGIGTVIKFDKKIQLIFNRKPTTPFCYFVVACGTTCHNKGGGKKGQLNFNQHSSGLN